VKVLEDALIVVVCLLFAAAGAVILIYNHLSRVDFWVARLWKKNDSRLEKWAHAAAAAAEGLDPGGAAAGLERDFHAARRSAKKQAGAMAALIAVSRVPADCAGLSGETVAALEELAHWERLLLDCLDRYRATVRPYNEKLEKGPLGWVGRRVLRMQPYPELRF